MASPDVSSAIELEVHPAPFVEIPEGRAQVPSVDESHAIELEMHRLDRQFRACFERVQSVEQAVNVVLEIAPDRPAHLVSAGWIGRGGSALADCVAGVVSHHGFARSAHLLQVEYRLQFKRDVR